MTGRNSLKQGSTRNWRLRFIQRNGQPVDFTGATALAKAVLVSDPSQAFEFDAYFEAPATNGVLVINVPWQTAALMPPGLYRWDVAIGFAGANQVWGAIEGDVEVRATVVAGVLA